MSDRSRPYVAVASALLLACLSSPTVAQTSGDRVASLSAELDSAIAARADALKTMSLADEKAAPMNKELKLWDEQAEAIKPQIGLYKAKLQYHQQMKAEVDAKVNAHNAGCSGTLPKPQYERCQGERPYLQSQIDKVHNSKVQLDGEFADLKKRADAIDKRRNELVDGLKNASAESQRARTQAADTQRRIDTLATRLRQECQNAGSREAMVHCGQVNWDGARRQVLPPPPDPPGLR